MNPTLIYKIVLALTMGAISFMLGGMVAFDLGNGLEASYSITLESAEKTIGLRSEFGGFYFGQAILITLALIRTDGAMLRMVAILVGTVAVFRMLQLAWLGTFIQDQFFISLIEAALVVLMLFAAKNFDKRAASSN